MKTKLLPSLSEVVEYEYITYQDAYLSIVLFNNFLKKKPEKWMFVPCSCYGNVLEKPKLYEWYKDCLDNGEACNLARSEEDLTDCEEYQQALDRVIFDGFEVVVHSYKNRTIEYKQMIVFNEDNYGKWSIGKYKTLADLVGKVYVNENGIKDSGI